MHTVRALLILLCWLSFCYFYIGNLNLTLTGPMGRFLDKLSGRLRPLEQMPYQQQQQPLVKTGGYKTGLYFANWSIYTKKHQLEDIDFSLVTHLFYAFVDIDPHSGKLKLSDPWADIQIPVPSTGSTGNLQHLYKLKQQHRHLKTAFSIGGWSYRSHFSAGVSTDKKIDNFVQSAIYFLKEYGFDGIDLDWEYPSNAAEQKQYIKLAQKLKLALQQVEKEKNLVPESLILTAAIPALPYSLRWIDLKLMDKYISFWNLMTYDFSGSWSEKAQYHSNLHPYQGGEWSASQGVQLLTSSEYKIDLAKIILGMPLYARRFEGTGGLNSPFSGVGGTEGIVDYKVLLGDQSVNDQFDSRAGTGYSYNSQTRTFLSYENVQSSQLKGKYTAQQKLGGGMWWESSGEVFGDRSKSIILNYVEQLGGPNGLDKSSNNLDYKESKYLNGN